MRSSPESVSPDLVSPDLASPRPAASAWEPPELGDRTDAPAPRLAVVPAQHVFEVSSTAGVPETLLAPARAAATHEGYVAGWNHGHRTATEQAAAQAEQARLAADQAVRERCAELDRAAEMLRTAALALAQRQADGVAEVERLIVDGTFELAETLVGLTLGDDERFGASTADARVTAGLERVRAVLTAGGPAVGVAGDPAVGTAGSRS